MKNNLNSKIGIKLIIIIILFISIASVYAKDFYISSPTQTIFFVNGSLNRIGIGTISPQEKLTITSGSNFVIEMSTPNPSASATTGGNLTAGTYYYKVSALDGVGETNASSVVSCTPDGATTNACQVSWSAIQGASFYRVYGRISSQDQYWTSSSTSYTDIGTPGTAATPPTITTAYVNKITASGNSWLLGGNLGINITSPTHLFNVYGHTNLSGNVTIEKDLIVKGRSYFRNFIFDDNALFTGNLTINNNLTVIGNTHLLGNLTLQETLKIGSNFFVNSSSVGIGTITPSRLLHLYSTSAAGTGFTIENSADNDAYIEFKAIDTKGYIGYDDDQAVFGLGIGLSNDLDLIFDSSGNAAFQNALIVKGILNATGAAGINGLYVDSSGNTGIGSASLNQKLVVTGDVNMSYGNQTLLYLDSDNNRVGIGTTAPTTALDVIGALNVSSGKSWLSNLLVNGSVGIGTATPTHPLSVMGAVNISNNLFVNGTVNIGQGITTTTALFKVAGGDVNMSYGNQTLLYLDSDNNRIGIKTMFPGSLLTVYDGDVNFSDTAGAGFFYQDSNQRVGINTFSPTHPLSVMGAVNISNNLFVNGTVNIGQGITTTTALFKVAGGDVNMSYGNQTLLYLDSDNNRIGIGTTSPGLKLHVVGSDASTGLGTGGVLQLANDVSADQTRTGIWLTTRVAGGKQALIEAVQEGTSNAASIRMSTYGASAWNTDAFVISSTGNVGIGEALNVSGKTWLSDLIVNGTLRVVQGTRTDGFNISASGTGNYFIESIGTGGFSVSSKGGQLTLQSGTSGDALVFQTGNTTATRMFITETGNVGIGTTSPGYPLHVYKGGVSGASDVDMLTLETRGTGAATENIVFMPGGCNGACLSYPLRIQGIQESADSGSNFGFNFEVRGSDVQRDAMTIKGSGNVGIGTTTPTHPLSVMGAVNISNNLFVNGTVSIGQGITTTTALFKVAGGDVNMSYGNQTTFYIDSDNNRIGIGTTSPTTALDIIGALNVSSGKTWLSDLIVNGSIRDYVSSANLNLTYVKLSNLNTTADQRIDLKINNSQFWYNQTLPAINYVTAQGYLNNYLNLALTNISETFDLNLTVSDTAIITKSLNVGSGGLFYNGGNVGIGTASPSSKLEVRSADNNLLTLLKLSNDYFSSSWSAGAELKIGEELSGGTPARWGAFRFEGNGANSFHVKIINNETAGDSGINFYTGGDTTTEKVRISESGNVGIGTTSPGYPLHVRSTAAFTAELHKAVSGGATILSLLHSTGTAAAPTQSTINHGSYIAFRGTDNATNPQLSAYIGTLFEEAVTSSSAAAALQFQTTPSGSVTPTEKLRITSAGNVGIGTTTPTHPLSVMGAVNISNNLFVNGSLRMTGSASNIILGSNYLSGDGNDEGVYVGSTGLVGIGTANPGYTLEVNGDIAVELTSDGWYYGDSYGTGTYRAALNLSVVQSNLACTYSAPTCSNPSVSYPSCPSTAVSGETDYADSGAPACSTYNGNQAACEATLRYYSYRACGNIELVNV